MNNEYAVCMRRIMMEETRNPNKRINIYEMDKYSGHWTDR